MGTRISPRKVAREIRDEAGKLNVTCNKDLLQIAEDIMGQYKLNQVERSIVIGLLEGLLDSESGQPSEK